MLLADFCQNDVFFGYPLSVTFVRFFFVSLPVVVVEGGGGTVGGRGRAGKVSFWQCLCGGGITWLGRRGGEYLSLTLGGAVRDISKGCIRIH